MDRPPTIQLCGYRKVFRFERRLFRLHDWRIPYPHGVPLRGIGYFVVFELCALCLARTPGLSLLASLFGPVLTFLLLPLGGAVVLMRVRIDGRPPHHVLASLIGYQLCPRCLAGLAPAPEIGEEVLPVEEATVAFDGRESFAVRGRIRGPAKVTFRYPSVGRVEGAPPWVRDPDRRKARARRYRIRRRPGARPMLRGKVISVPRGREVVVE
jgi:hypothetical protein